MGDFFYIYFSAGLGNLVWNIVMTNNGKFADNTVWFIFKEMFMDMPFTVIFAILISSLTFVVFWPMTLLSLIANNRKIET